MNIKIEYKYIQSNIFIVSAAYLFKLFIGYLFRERLKNKNFLLTGGSWLFFISPGWWIGNKQLFKVSPIQYPQKYIQKYGIPEQRIQWLLSNLVAEYASSSHQAWMLRTNLDLISSPLIWRQFLTIYDRYVDHEW